MRPIATFMNPQPASQVNVEVKIIDVRNPGILAELSNHLSEEGFKWQHTARQGADVHIGRVSCTSKEPIPVTGVLKIGTAINAAGIDLVE